MSSCDYGMIPAHDIPTSNVGWMYPMNSMLQPLFDSCMQDLYESGITDRILKRLEDPCTTKSQFQISFDFVMVLFLILAVGIVLALTTLGLEFFFTRMYAISAKRPSRN